MSTVGRSWHCSPSGLSSGSIAASEFSRRRKQGTLTTHLQHLESGGLDSYCACAKNKGELWRNPRLRKQKLLWHWKSVTPTFVVRCSLHTIGQCARGEIFNGQCHRGWQCFAMLAVRNYPGVVLPGPRGGGGNGAADVDRHDGRRVAQLSPYPTLLILVPF
jgi:hypothetical protein